MTKIRCTHCDGKGNAELSPILERTLASVPCEDFTETKCIRHSCAVKGQRKDTSTAINNRLNILLGMGLIEVKEIGRSKLWKRVK